MQHPSTHLLTANPASTSTKTTRRSLPHKKVNAETLEHAYVQFILYCNPGVPLETDTAALREAFRIPPKSGGKSFSTYTLFELIKQFQNKEIKTWAELALRLGVDPPDQDKGQSTQKIQQYAVRLKRWMHSMHVDAFFDYMLNNPHPYWTEVPQDPNPIIEEGRDGVAAEDDMALRSLLPHIRPRRGRKRPEDEDSSLSPSQRPKMEGVGSDFGPGGGSQQLDIWSAPSEGGSGLFPSQDPYGRMSMNMGNLGTSWTGENFVQTPLTAHAYSAITPSTGQALWAEPSEEPKSAITTSKPKPNRRHGAKVVSSAWRSGGPGGSGKTRGRPPLNRQISNSTNDPSSPFSAFPAQSSVVRQHSPHVNPNIRSPMITHSPTAPGATVTSIPQANLSTNQQHETPFGTPQQNQAQARDLRPIRSRLSLHVPERTSGGVRLATPPGPQPAPPVVMVNGTTIAGHQSVSFNNLPAGASTTAMDDFGAMNNPYVPFQPQQHYQAAVPPLSPAQYTSSHPGTQQPQQHPSQKQQSPGVNFTDPEDRTNIEELVSLFAYDMVVAEWFDSAGNPLPACSVEEAVGMSQQIIEDVMHGATTNEAFLINMAALAGGSLLKSDKNIKVHRAISGDGFSMYNCHWEMRLGDIKGSYSVQVTLADSKWKRRVSAAEQGGEEEEQEDAEGEEDNGGAHEKGDSTGEAERWQRKYRDLLDVVQQQKSELSDFRRGVIKLCHPGMGGGSDEGMSG
ncbi:ARS-binding protein 2 [Cytospora mali]|uniref:ARS-binding protein 2 n=1 Tax=Cytospora mali TaxID=578113 RepID=A0A194V2B1_CYTMA|nr:ARS-binding protein 2 [Valsa mali var. pyri (nom. inval.)]